VIDGSHVAAAEPAQPDAAPVEGDDGCAVDEESSSSPVELANRDAADQHPQDDAAVFRRGGRRSRAHGDERGANEHEREPSHTRMLFELRQHEVWPV
jgi:hypothetical protein